MKPPAQLNLAAHYAKRLRRSWRQAPFVLRITTWRDVTGPVLVVKERHSREPKPLLAGLTAPQPPHRDGLAERGHISGEAQRRVLPVLRAIVERVADPGGVPYDLGRYLTPGALREARTLPLDEEAGSKLALIFRLQERVSDLDRVELIARRVARFTAEEAGYWFSRVTSFGPEANRWAASGMRIMLGGQPGDPAIGRILEGLRQK